MNVRIRASYSTRSIPRCAATPISSEHLNLCVLRVLCGVKYNLPQDCELILPGVSAARVAAAVSITPVLGLRAPHAQRSLQTLLPKAAAPEVSCGTSVDRELRGIHTYAATELRDGEVLSFDQDPALVPPAYSGTVTLRNFTVMGDLRTIQFRRADRPDAPPETWSRLTTKSVNG